MHGLQHPFGSDGPSLARVQTTYKQAHTCVCCLYLQLRVSVSIVLYLVCTTPVYRNYLYSRYTLVHIDCLLLVVSDK